MPEVVVPALTAAEMRDCFAALAKDLGEDSQPEPSVDEEFDRHEDELEADDPLHVDEDDEPVDTTGAPVRTTAEKAYSGGGAMIALSVPSAVATALQDLADVEIDDPHLTLLYLGQASHYDADQREAIADLVSELDVVDGEVEITGWGVWPTDSDDAEHNWCLVALVDAPGLAERRTDLQRTLSESLGVEQASEHGFIPHVTVAYTVEKPDVPESPRGLTWEPEPYVHFDDVAEKAADLPLPDEGQMPAVERERLREQAELKVTRWETQVEDLLSAFWQRQEQVVLARLTGTKARKHTRHWDPPGTKALDPSYVVDEQRWAEALEVDVRALVERLFDEAAEEVEYQLGGSPPEETEKYRREREAEVARRVEAMVAYARSKVDAVRDAIRDAEARGEDMDAVARAVQEEYEHRPAWAQAAARTFTTEIVNGAEWWHAVKRGAKSKEWLSSRDERVRASHARADRGRPIGIRATWKMGGSRLRWPGDPQGAPEHVVNCRCTLLFSRTKPRR